MLSRPPPDIRIFAADRKSTRLNSSHPSISYDVFCLKKPHHRGHLRRESQRERDLHHVERGAPAQVPDHAEYRRAARRHRSAGRGPAQLFFLRTPPTTILNHLPPRATFHS